LEVGTAVVGFIVGNSVGSPEGQGVGFQEKVGCTVGDGVSCSSEVDNTVRDSLGVLTVGRMEGISLEKDTDGELVIDREVGRKDCFEEGSLEGLMKLGWDDG
jgi:hypothetical protein